MIKETPKIIKKLKNKKYAQNPVLETNSLEGIEPDIGEHTDDGDDSPLPHGRNNGEHGNPHVGDDRKGSTDEGDNDIIRLVPLTDLKKVFFVSNKDEGTYILKINSIYEETDCELEMFFYDDSGSQYKVDVIECSVNGIKTEIENGRAVKFKIVLGKNTVILKTDLKDYYRCEVKLYANR